MRVGIDTGDVVVGRPRRAPGPGLHRRRRDGQPGQPPPVGGAEGRCADLGRHLPPRPRFVLAPTAARAAAEGHRRAGRRLRRAERAASAASASTRRAAWRASRPRTIGRDRELHQLQDLFRDVEDEQTYRVVTIVGDAGVGKTRLMGELDRWLAEIPEPVWWFRGRASPWWENRPNALLRDILVTPTRDPRQRHAGGGQGEVGRRVHARVRRRARARRSVRGCSPVAGDRPR